MKLDEIWRYPVKSLSGATVERTVLNPGQGLPQDRRWALARADSEALRTPGWQPKAQFLVLVREYSLAQLNCRFEDMSGHFSIEGPDGLHAEGNLMSAEGRAAIVAAVARHLGLDDAQTPVIVEATEIGYFDTTQGPVSLLNLASHQALEHAIGHSIDRQRWRMNFAFSGTEPWAESLWPGKRLSVGKAVLRITEPTGRCKATHVNPHTGEADVKLMHALKEHFGHTQMGVYAQVEDGGPVRPGDAIALLD